MKISRAAIHHALFGILVFLFGILSPAAAQVPAPLYLMPDYFYGQMANPAFMRNDEATTLAVPLMAGFSAANYGNVRLSDLIVVSDAGKPIVSFDRFARLAEPENQSAQHLAVPLFYYSTPRKNGTLSFYYRENMATSATFTKDAFDFVLSGNSSSNFRSFDSQEINLFVLNYREFALGYARKWQEKWQAGVRAKLLFGQLLLRAENWHYGLETSYDGGQVRLFSKGAGGLYSPWPAVLTDQHRIDGITFDEVFQPYFLNFNQPGLAIDLGLTRILDDRSTLSFAVLDLGGIWFRKNAMNMAQNGNHIFSGFDISGAVGSPDDPDYIDSEWSVYYEKLKIRDVFQPLTDTARFVQGLIPKTVLHYQYDYSPKLSFGISNQSAFGPYHFRNILSLSAIHRGERFSFFENVSLHQAGNVTIGAGLRFDSDKFQAVLAIDNLLALYHPAGQRNYFITFGTSFLMNSDRNNLPGKRRKTTGRNGRASEELPFYEKKR